MDREIVNQDAGTAAADERILGYGDRLSVSPGDKLGFHISSPRGAYNLEFVRLTAPTTWGPDSSEVVVAQVAGQHNGKRQDSTPGSLLHVANFPRLQNFSLSIVAQPTLFDGVERALMSWALPGSPGLYLSQSGAVLRLAEQGGEPHELRVDIALDEREWYQISATYNATSGQTTLEVRGLRLNVPEPRLQHSSRRLAAGLHIGDSDFAIGAGWQDGRASGHFNGKLARPVITDGHPDPAMQRRVAWDFASEFVGPEIPSSGTWALSARLVNFPVRAVTGPDWDAVEIDFRHVPDQYDAIHFHDDSVEDMGWEQSFLLDVPTDWRSGFYAAVVSDGETRDEIPFFVKPAPGQEAPVLLLVPTNTYLAYANEHTFIADREALSAMKDEQVVLHRNDEYLSRHRELGLALYDSHSDGVGCPYSSMLRPILNMRPDYESWLIGAVRNYPADLVLVAFLEHAGIDYSVATDDDVAREGVDLLRRYRAVITGSHPEYQSGAEIDAMQEYLRTGGRLAYLGGNGYWGAISYEPTRRHYIETRRGKNEGPYFGPPGQQHHNTNGEPGGCWFDLGRASHGLVGVGCTARGWGTGRPYTRTEGANDPRWSWIFDGVPEGVLIGEEGLACSAAGGDEIDRVDPLRGTPPHTTVLASATDFSDVYQPVLDEHSIYVPDGLGGSQNPDVRADMVAFETGHGGGVFSVGSIAWCAALAPNNFDNPVSQVTRNVVQRFAHADSIVGQAAALAR